MEKSRRHQGVSAHFFTRSCGVICPSWDDQSHSFPVEKELSRNTGPKDIEVQCSPRDCVKERAMLGTFWSRGQNQRSCKRAACGSKQLRKRASPHHAGPTICMEPKQGAWKLASLPCPSLPHLSHSTRCDRLVDSAYQRSELPWFLSSPLPLLFSCSGNHHLSQNQWTPTTNLVCLHFVLHEAHKNDLEPM